MTLGQFEEYMNEVEAFAADLDSVNRQPFLCWCFNLRFVNDPIKSAAIKLTEWFKPNNTTQTAWFDLNGWNCSENTAARITALFLFEQICISEKLYLDF